MLSRRRMLFVLPLLLLPSHVHAQSPNPVSTSDKSDAQTSASGSPFPASQRITITFKYTEVGYSCPSVTGTFPNGQQANLLVDTGSDASAISDDLAKKLALSPDESRKSSKTMLVDGKPIKSVLLPNFVIKLSPLSYPLSNSRSQVQFTLNGVVAVFPRNRIAFPEADGIFGTALLTGVAAIFDGPKKEVAFVLGGKLTAKERKELGFPASAAFVVASPPTIGGKSLVTIPVTLENNGVSRQVTLIVDTGSNQTSIPREDALVLGLVSVRSTTALGAAGSQQVENAPVETLRIGDLAIHGVSVTFPSKGNATSQTIGPKGSVKERLGMDILAGYRVLIDLPASRMYIMPEEPQIKILGN